MNHTYTQLWGGKQNQINITHNYNLRDPLNIFLRSFSETSQIDQLSSKWVINYKTICFWIICFSIKGFKNKKKKAKTPMHPQYLDFLPKITTNSTQSNQTELETILLGAG